MAPTVRRRLHQLIIVLYACAILGSVAMVAGPAYNDFTISRDPGRGIATVTGVGLTRTSVDYQDESGEFHSPQRGLLYPSGLGDGQQVWVTYAKSNPEIVKVEGRGWTLAIVPALSVGAVATLIAAAAWLGVSALGKKSRTPGGKFTFRSRESKD
ncbi:DUF3592 domain-containing protein [Corynebacterium sp. P8-C1]|uniref:DUF3592 domain-containing protein n=1 Tax=Corynebacterium sp. P8-C1 TaxID=3059082 RepID=UPI00265D5DF7|nr:DUF3592 domain-containing protein [Corynebacterium sp. P8-C1]WKK62361.1 DUF3592 domain-containing protein [Corynebacterium sp. P8-C1]